MPSHSVVRKAHAWLLLSKYSRDQLSYDEVAFITGPSGMYPFSEREMSRQTLDRLVERAGQTGDPGSLTARSRASVLESAENVILQSKIYI